MRTCFPSMTPHALGKFHFEKNLPLISFNDVVVGVGFALVRKCLIIDERHLSTIRPIVEWCTLYWNANDRKVSPVAKYLNVIHNLCRAVIGIGIQFVGLPSRSSFNESNTLPKRNGLKRKYWRNFVSSSNKCRWINTLRAPSSCLDLYNLCGLFLLFFFSTITQE